MNAEIGEIHQEGRIVALGIQAHDIASVGRNCGHGIQIHRRRQHAAAIVVGVVAHDFGATRRGDEGLGLPAEVGAEGVCQGAIAIVLILSGVERAEAIGIALKDCFDIHICDSSRTYFSDDIVYQFDKMRKGKRRAGPPGT